MCGVWFYIFSFCYVLHIQDSACLFIYSCICIFDFVHPFAVLQNVSGLTCKFANYTGILNRHQSQNVMFSMLQPSISACFEILPQKEVLLYHIQATVRGPLGVVPYVVYVQLHRSGFLSHNLQVQTPVYGPRSSNSMLQN